MKYLIFYIGSRVKEFLHAPCCISRAGKPTKPRTTAEDRRTRACHTTQFLTPAAQHSSRRFDGGSANPLDTHGIWDFLRRFHHPIVFHPIMLLSALRLQETSWLGCKPASGSLRRPRTLRRCSTGMWRYTGWPSGSNNRSFAQSQGTPTSFDCACRFQGRPECRPINTRTTFIPRSLHWLSCGCRRQ